MDLTNHRGENRIQTTAYIDTGSDASAIPLNLLNDIQARHINRRWARAIEGTRYAVNTYIVTVYIGTHTLPGIEVIANEHTNEVIIGRDILNQLNLNLDGLGLLTSVQEFSSPVGFGGTE